MRNRVLFLVLGALLAYVGVVRAASVTLTLTNQQIATLNWAYAQAGAASSGFASADLYLSDVVAKRIIAEWDGQKGRKDKTDFCTAFLVATTGQQNAACNAIGAGAGCNPCQ